VTVLLVPASRSDAVVPAEPVVVPHPRLTGGRALTRRRLGRHAGRLLDRRDALRTRPGDELLARFAELRSRAQTSGEVRDEDLREAIALAAALAPAHLGLDPYPVQLLGALVVSSGMVAEMMTGEGKTLAIALGALALALPGRGVHVVTANEYLAARDAAFLAPFAGALGLSVGLSRQGASLAERIAAHRCDITYGTANSFGFDYLYDNLAFLPSEVAGREPFAVIVDEADAVLLDEARTPLLVSVLGEPSRLGFARLAEVVARLDADADVYLDPSGSSVTLLAPGVEKVEALLADVLDGRSLYEAFRLVQQVQAALDARFLYRSGVDYLVTGEDATREVVLVDANTGRRREQSRLRAGLHEAIEAKEGVPLRPSGVTRGMVSVQNFFARYPRLGGMSGTAIAAAEEFMEFYGRDVLGVPPHRPLRRVDLPDRVFATAAQRDEQLLVEVTAWHTAGRPVLVAADSVAECERVGELLASHLPVRVLSARDPDAEAAIVSRAGEPGAVTVTTAMAGRGVDILLGGLVGEPAFAADRDAVLAAGGLAVVSVCRFPSRRVDAQLRGRAGRQGEPGSSLFLLSFEDDLPRRFAPSSVRGLLAGADGELPARLAANVFDRAQSALEAEHLAARRSVRQADEPLRAHREEFYAFRRRLLDMPAWPRLVAVVSTGFDRALPARVVVPRGAASESFAERAVRYLESALDGVWPASPEFSALLRERVIADPRLFSALSHPSPGDSRSVVCDALVEVFLDVVRARLADVEAVPEPDRSGIVNWAFGSVVLDALDLVWAGHLEEASGLHADANLTARTGQDPDRIYRSMLDGSFDGVFDRFFRVALDNVARIDKISVTASEPSPSTV